MSRRPQLLVVTFISFTQARCLIPSEELTPLLRRIEICSFRPSYFRPNAKVVSLAYRDIADTGRIRRVRTTIGIALATIGWPPTTHWPSSFNLQPLLSISDLDCIRICKFDLPIIVNAKHMKCANTASTAYCSGSGSCRSGILETGQYS